MRKKTTSQKHHSVDTPIASASMLKLSTGLRVLLHANHNSTNSITDF